MDYTWFSLLASFAMLVGMFALLLLGRYIGQRRLDDTDNALDPGTTTVNAAIFGLLGLMIAFTFSGAASRFDERRDLIVQEANNIGTAWLRIDLLPPQDQPAMRDLLRSYTESRLMAYRLLPDEVAAMAALTRSQQLQSDIWAKAITVTGAQGTPNTAAMLLLPALNDMFDITTTRTMAAKKHPPPVIYYIMGGLALISALFAGHAMAGTRHQSLLHLLGFPTIISIAIFMILNLEHPRLGAIKIQSFDDAIAAVLAGMG